VGAILSDVRECWGEFSLHPVNGKLEDEERLKGSQTVDEVSQMLD
jgi:hypothetical protein